MNITRRTFLGTAAAAAATAASTKCLGAAVCCAKPKTQVGVQLYSIREYIGGNANKGIKGVGLAQALKDVAAIGYKGVEFAGYYGNDARTVKAMLDDAGLKACGTHVHRNDFSPEKIKQTCEFNLGFGNTTIICPGGGNFPAKGQDFDEFMKMLVDFYNVAAEEAKKFGCKIGLHNHTGEFKMKMKDGTTYWDYFFSNTVKEVCMEQDVGWTTCAGVDPCEQYKKFPGRSPTLHAKENGMGSNVKQFDAILGQPGRDAEGNVCAKGVEWDRLFPVTDADGVGWYVVECERHSSSLAAIKPSFEFLKGKGRA